MSEKHLTKGDPKPPLQNGKLRLYSMLFCPFAERPRLILKVKGIPHDIVNVNLKEKPDWLFELHPEGKVPALETDSEVIIESLDISDYLDEKYPNPPLHSTDQNQKDRDKEYAKNFVKYFAKIPFDSTFEDFIAKVRIVFQEIEDELKNRGGKFFGGETPLMVDYMIWPFAERAPVYPKLFGRENPFTEEEFPRLVAWYKGMLSQKAVQDTIIDLEKHLKFTKLHRSGQPLDYDDI